jgi:F-type H+-transporting ATPase subunit delta
LRGYATAVIAGIARDAIGADVAEDLNAIAHLVSRTNVLAVTLTDFGVPVDARRAVLEDLLEGRVHPVARRIVLRAVETERADELPTVLHELYEFARHLHELDEQELEAEEPIAGATVWRQYASGYSAAVFESVAEVSHLEEIEDELFRFARVVESTPSLAQALRDSTVPVDARERLLDDVLHGKVLSESLRLAKVTVQGRVRDVVSALDWLVEQAAHARGWRVARVRTALPIDAEEQSDLAGALQRLTHRPVELQVLEEPELLGGAVVQIGDLLVDASARHRLEQLEEQMLRPDTMTRGA